MSKTTGKTSPPQAGAETGPNDVLLGRGYLAVKHEGNVRFRQLVQEYQERYASATEVTGKHDVACNVVRKIKERNGRFLRRRSDTDGNQNVPEADDVGPLDHQRDAWVPVDDSVSIEKVKQTFRDLKLKAKGGNKSSKSRKKKNTVDPSPPSPSQRQAQAPQEPATSVELRQIKLQQDLFALQQQQVRAQQAEREELLRSLMNQRQQQPQQQVLTPALLAALSNISAHATPQAFAPAPHSSLLPTLNSQAIAVLQEELQRRSRVQDALVTEENRDLFSASALTGGGGVVSDYLRANLTNQHLLPLKQLLLLQQQQQQPPPPPPSGPTPSQLAAASRLLGVSVESILQNPIYSALSQQLNKPPQVAAAAWQPQQDEPPRSSGAEPQQQPPSFAALVEMALRQQQQQRVNADQDDDRKPPARKRSNSDPGADRSGKRSRNNLHF